MDAMDEPAFDDEMQEKEEADEETKEEGFAVVGGDQSTGAAVPAEERITTPYMTKYERARVLGTRALQIRCAYSFPLFLSI
jgi:DNA-directed RNA polymerase I, II, and III subunit RPABC2